VVQSPTTTPTPPTANPTSPSTSGSMASAGPLASTPSPSAEEGITTGLNVQPDDGELEQVVIVVIIIIIIITIISNTITVIALLVIVMTIHEVVARVVAMDHTTRGEVTQCLIQKPALPPRRTTTSTPAKPGRDIL
jgi:hypothetical protein